MKLLKSRRSAQPKELNRRPSGFLARIVPWASVMGASLLAVLPIIASAPALPPFGFMAFIAWRQIHPSLLPVWAGLPLGLFDDLFNGQPFGSSTLLWSIAILLIDQFENRFPIRHFIFEWLFASLLIVSYLIASLGLADLGGGSSSIRLIYPQLGLSILCYPLVGRALVVLDRLRLAPIRVI